MKKIILILCMLFSFGSAFAQGFQCEGFTRDLKVLSKRMHGQDVVMVQTALSKTGLLPESEIDGYYGPITESAVKAFQKDSWLKDNGIVDVLTFYLLTQKNDLLEAVKKCIMSDAEFNRFIGTLSFEEHSVSGLSTEGGEINLGYKDGQVCCSMLELCGEYGMSTDTYINPEGTENSGLFIHYEKHYENQFDMGDKSLDTEEKVIFFLYDEKFLLLKDGKFELTKSVVSEDLMNMLMGKVSFDEEE